MRPTAFLLTLFASACTFPLDSKDPAEADGQIRPIPRSVEEFAHDYAAAFVDGDPAKVGALFTEDFVAMAPESPALEGRDQAVRYITADLGRMKVRWLEFDVVDAVTHGEWAWVRGESAGEMVLAGVRHMMPLEGKFLWILRKQSDGGWRLAIDASSANKPHSHGTAPPGPASDTTR